MRRSVSQYFHDLSLRSKLIISYTALVIAIVLIIGLTTYNISLKRVKDSESKLLLQNLKQTASMIDFNLEMYMKKSDIIFSNTILQSAMSNEYQDIYDTYEAYQNSIYKILEPVIQEVVNPEMRFTSGFQDVSGIVEVVIYSNNSSLQKDGGIIRDFEDVKNERWVKDIYNREGRFIWRGLFTVKQIKYISINRVLKAFKNLEDLGILSIMIPESRLKYLLKQNNESMPGEIYLIDSEYNLVTNSKTTLPLEQNNIKELLNQYVEGKDGIVTYQAAGKKYILAYTESSITGWKLAALLPANFINDRVKTIKYLIVLMLIVCIVISIIITIMVSHFTTRRLGRIVKKMNRLKADRNTPLEEISGQDEIGQLDRNFNDMMMNLNEMVEREKMAENQRLRLQMELLQAQMNPHLLYNTLSTISWKAKKAGAADVCSVTEDLIRFFKYFLNKGELVTRLSNEIDMVRNYLNILKFTYHMEFDDHMDIQEELLSYSSINMILQPVVENALVHGIKPAGKRGMIEIYATLTGGDILFRIKDNGIGMEPELVEKLNKGEVVHSTRGGYGLGNVIKRIKLYYGGSYGLSISSRINEGTEVTIRIPALYQHEMEQKLNSVF